MTLREHFEEEHKDLYTTPEEMEIAWQAFCLDLEAEESCPLNLQFRTVQIMGDGRVEIQCECGEVFTIDPARETNMVRRDGNPEDLLIRCPKCGAEEGVQ